MENEKKIKINLKTRDMEELGGLLKIIIITQ